jgi:uncharacterized membrane protein YhaH (DUF805 family)
MVNKCPRCGLINPPDAQRCDCGYDFVGRPTLSASRISFRTLFFSLDGRIGRSTYWLKFFLPYVVVYVALVLLDLACGTIDHEAGMGVFSGVFLLLTMYSSIAVGVKRCHDRDRSGWFLLVGIVPGLNLWLLVELGLLEGTVGPNTYGLPELRVA